MKRLSILFAILVLLLWPVLKPVRAAGRINQSLMITSGSPIQIAPTGTIADELLIQPATGSTVGTVYVMAGIAAGRTPSKSNATDVTAQLAAATSTTPGQAYSDGTTVQQSAGVNVGAIWIDVATTNTVVLVSYAPR